MDIDLADLDNFVPAVPHQWFEHLRREAPAYWQKEPDGPGFWNFTRYPDVVAINRDWETFSSHRGGALLMEQDAESLEQQRLMMLNMDPPMHTRYRLLVNKGFTPRMIGRLEEQIRHQANLIIDGVCEQGQCDFVTDIAAELPLQVIADVMGVPQEDRHKVFDWSNRMIGAEDPEYKGAPEATYEASMELYAYANTLAAQKRANPSDDIISVLLDAEVDGERLSEFEFDLFFLLLSVAGNETTRNLISHGMQALCDFPDQRQKLLDDPSKLPGAVEEMLRWGTPVMHFRRTATRDTEVAGQAVAEGDKVVIWYISANRDESVFDDPYTFDIERTPNDHVAFGGGGPHFCLGHNLARLEIRIIFEELLRRLPDIRPAGPVARLRSNFINGIKHMPIEFTPTARAVG
jgi:cholest-4-en-3-one 26-monooxygenase